MRGDGLEASTKDKKCFHHITHPRGKRRNAINYNQLVELDTVQLYGYTMFLSHHIKHTLSRYLANQLKKERNDRFSCRTNSIHLRLPRLHEE
jgi:hypothetical protein